MDIYTPDEQLHRMAAAQSQRDRFIVRWLTGENPKQRKAFGSEIESAIANRLREKYHVSKAGSNEHYDLIVNGLRVEVKAAARSSDNRYQAALRSNDADVLILCCIAGDGVEHYFVMPFDTVAGLKKIKISSDPQTYTGRHSAWLEAWSLIDKLIERGVNHWQPVLF